MSVPFPAQLKESPTYEDFSFEDKINLIDEWALDVRKEAESEIDDPELLFKINQEIDKDIDTWRSELEEDKPYSVYWKNVGKSAASSLAGMPGFYAGLVEDAARKVGSTGEDELDNETRNWEILGKGAYYGSNEFMRWAVEKMPFLSPEAAKQYEQSVESFESFIKDRSNYASPDENFKARLFSHLNEMKKNAFILQNREDYEVKEKPTDTELKLIAAYTKTRNPQFLEALYAAVQTTALEEELEKAKESSGGIIRGGQKAVLKQFFGDKIANTVDEASIDLTSSPLDAFSMLFGVFKGAKAAAAARAGKGLGPAARNIAEGMAVEGVQEGVDSVIEGTDPVEGVKMGLGSGLVFGATGAATNAGVNAIRKRMAKKAGEIIKDDFDIDLTTPNEDAPSDGLLAPDDDFDLDTTVPDETVGQDAVIDDSSFQGSFKGAKVTVFGGGSDPIDAGINDKGEKTGPGGREGVSLRKSIQTKLFGEDFKNSRENYSVRVKLPDGGFKDYDIVDHGPAEDIVEKEGREVLDITEGVAKDLGLNIMRDENGQIIGNDPINLDFDIVKKETGEAVHLNETDLDGWTVPDSEGIRVEFPKNEIGARARAVYENIQDSANSYIDSSAEGLSVSTAQANRSKILKTQEKLLGAVRNLSSQDPNVVQAAEKDIKKMFSSRRGSQLTKDGRARDPKVILETLLPETQKQEATKKSEVTEEQIQEEQAKEPALSRDEIIKRIKTRPETEGLGVGERIKKTQELTDASGKIIDADLDAIIRDILSRREINPASNISEEVDRLQQKLESLDENNPKNIEAREQVLDALSDYLLLENIDPNRLASIKKETTAAEENIQKASGILGGAIDQVRASKAGRNIASNRGIDPAIDMRIDDLAGRQAPPSSTQGVVTRQEAELGGVPFEPVITEGEAGRAREAARTKPLSSGELAKSRPLFDVTADPKKRKFVNDLQRDAREMIRNNMLTGESVDIGLVNELSRDLSEAIYRHMPDVKMEDFQKLIRLPEVQDHLNEQAQVSAVGAAPLPSIESLRPAIEAAFPTESPSFINRAINAIIYFLKKVRDFFSVKSNETGAINPKGNEGKNRGKQVKSFTTEKGSTYTVDQSGKTTRDKAKRNDPGHEGDFGPKRKSEKTIYVKDSASALSAAGLQGGKIKARVAIKGNKASLLMWNEKENRWGVSPSSRNIEFSTEPQVGYSPLELWDSKNDVPGYEAYSGMHAGNKITSINGEKPTKKRETPPELKRPADPLADQIKKTRKEILKRFPENTFAESEAKKALDGIVVNRLTNVQLNELGSIMNAMTSKVEPRPTVTSFLKDLRELNKLSKEGTPRDASSNPAAQAKYAEAISDLNAYINAGMDMTVPDRFQSIAFDAADYLRNVDTSKMDLRQLNNHVNEIYDLISGKLGLIGKYSSLAKIDEVNAGINRMGGASGMFLGNPKFPIWEVSAHMPSQIEAIFASPNARKVHESGYGDNHSGITRFERRRLDARDRAEQFFNKYKINAEENSRAYAVGLLTQWNDDGTPIIKQFKKILDDVQKGINALLESEDVPRQTMGRVQQRHLNELTSGGDVENMTAQQWERHLYNKLTPKERRFLDFMRKESAKPLEELKWVTENILGKKFTGYRNYIHRDAIQMGTPENATDLEAEHLDYRLKETGEKQSSKLGSETGISEERTGLGDKSFYNLDGLSSLLNGVSKAYYTIETAYGRKVIKNLHLNDAYVNAIGKKKIAALDKVYRGIHSSHLGDRIGNTIPMAIYNQFASNLSAFKLSAIKNLVAQPAAIVDGMIRLGPTGVSAFTHALSNLGNVKYNKLIHDFAPQVKERLRHGDVAFDRVAIGSYASQFMRALEQDSKHNLKSKLLNYGSGALKGVDTAWKLPRELSRFVNLAPESLVLNALWTANYIKELVNKGTIKSVSEFNPDIHRDAHAANVALRAAEAPLGNPTSIAMRAELFKSNSWTRKAMADTIFRFTQSLNGLSHDQANSFAHMAGGLYATAMGRGSKDINTMLWENMKATVGRGIQAYMFVQATAYINAYLLSPLLASVFLDSDELDDDEQKMFRKQIRLQKELMTSDKRTQQNIRLEMARLAFPILNNSLMEGFLRYSYDGLIGDSTLEHEKKLIASLDEELKEAKRMLRNGETTQERVDNLQYAIDLHRKLRDSKTYYGEMSPADGYGSIEFIWDFLTKNSALEALEPGELSGEGHVRAMNLITGLGMTNPDIERYKREAKKFREATEEKREKKRARELQAQ